MHYVSVTGELREARDTYPRAQIPQLSLQHSVLAKGRQYQAAIPSVFPFWERLVTPAEGHGASSWHGVCVAAKELLQVPLEPEPLLGHPSLLATAGPWSWTTTLLNSS